MKENGMVEPVLGSEDPEAGPDEPLELPLEPWTMEDPGFEGVEGGLLGGLDGVGGCEHMQSTST